MYTKTLVSVLIFALTYSLGMTQVKSTKTSFFIDLQPDKLDSLIAESNKKESLQKQYFILNTFHFLNFGFSVGTSLVERQQVQVVGSIFDYEFLNEHYYYSARFNRLYFENEGVFLTDIRQYLMSLGLQFKSSEQLHIYGLKLIAGASHRFDPNNELWGAAGGVGINYTNIFTTHFVSFLQAELYGIYSLNEPLIEGKLSYFFMPHQIIICSFNFRHIEIPKLVSSDSFGFSVGFLFSDFFVLDKK